MLFLSQKWVDKLAGLPETGMGYQIVDVYLKNGTIVRGLTVVNCEQIVVPESHSFSENDIQDIWLSQSTE
ncbi:MAG: hypothetical protein HYX21_03700 [Candidatus Yanofskybacteria bacterium]|nr:hypothetical protein [Candidatus Yanofskybacteria bacterium]